MKGCISMIMSELSCIETIQKVLEKSLNQSEASNILNVSDRQIRRMVRRYKNEGATGLISKKKDGRWATIAYKKD
jgi:transposase